MPKINNKNISVKESKRWHLSSFAYSTAFEMTPNQRLFNLSACLAKRALFFFSLLAAYTTGFPRLSGSCSGGRPLWRKRRIRHNLDVAVPLSRFMIVPRVVEVVKQETTRETLLFAYLPSLQTWARINGWAVLGGNRRGDERLSMTENRRLRLQLSITW